MSTNNVVEMQETLKCGIVIEYEKLLEEITMLQEDARFWADFLDAPQVKEFLAGLQHEIDETKLAWESIAPKDFALSQARVQALSRLLSEVQHKADDIRAELGSKRQIKTRIESDSAAILYGAGYRFEHEPAAPDSESEEKPDFEGADRNTEETESRQND